MNTITDILEAKGYSLLGEPKHSTFPRASSLMTAEAIDKTDRKVFIKIGKHSLIKPCDLYKSYQLLVCLQKSDFNNEIVNFPKAIDYFRTRNLSFLIQEFIDHNNDIWKNMNEIEKFHYFKEIILCFDKISKFPPLLEKYNYNNLLKILKKYSKYINKNSSSINLIHLKIIIEIFRDNKKIFEEYYGKFSHNDIHTDNLLYNPTRSKFYLVDVDTCRISNQFSDFARCYNRASLRYARTYYLNNGGIKYFEFDDIYNMVLNMYRNDAKSKKMFDIMILSDNLMYLYFVLKHQNEDKLRQFTEKFFSLIVDRRLKHF